LDKTESVPQIDESNTTVVTATMDPPCKGYDFPGMGSAEFTAGMCFMHLKPPKK
jgi:hypothetical protein